MVDPLAGYGRIHGVGGHISPHGQLRHWGYPMAEPLGALVLKQMALDFGQGQDRWHAGFYRRRCQPETAYF